MRSAILQTIAAVGLTLGVFGCSSEPPFVDFGDRKPPELVKREPAEGATEVPIDTDIVAGWSEALATQPIGFIGLVLLDGQGKTVEGFLMHESSLLRFRPTHRLKHDEEYTVKTSPHLTDLFGNKLKEVSWSFRTAADREPPFTPYNLVYKQITNELTTALSGTKEGNSRLEINGELVEVSLPETSFTVFLSLQEEGENHFELVSIDKAGNRSAGKRITIIRDTVPPEKLSSLCGNLGGEEPATEVGLLWEYKDESGCWNPPNPFLWNGGPLPLGFSWTPDDDSAVLVTVGAWRQQIKGSSFEIDNILAYTPKNSSSATLHIVTIDEAGNITPAFEREIILKGSLPALVVDGLPAGVESDGVLSTRSKSGILEVRKKAQTKLSATQNGATLAPEPGCDYVAEVTCRFPWGVASDGDYHFAMVITDSIGSSQGWRRTFRVDGRVPEISHLPRQGALIGGEGIRLHLFFDEPVTSVSSDFPGEIELGTFPFDSSGTNGQFWRSNPVNLADGIHQFGVTWYDETGNKGEKVISFETASGVPTPPALDAPAPSFTAGTRSGLVRFEDLGDAPLKVIGFRESGQEDYRLAVTTESYIEFEADTLAQIEVIVSALADAISSDAHVDFIPPAPAIDSIRFVTPGVAIRHAAPLYFNNGYALIARKNNEVFWAIDDFASSGPSMPYLADTGCKDAEAPIPMAPLSSGEYALGPLCDNSDKNLKLVLQSSFSGNSPLLASLGALPFSNTNFDIGIAAGRLYGNVHGEQLAVSERKIGGGTIYVYETTGTTSTPRILHMPETVNSGFGSGLAIAEKEDGTGRLAVLASGEQAVYLSEGSALKAEGPATWSRRIPTQVDATCLDRAERPMPMNLEVIAVGDIDGDGSKDFVVFGYGEIPGWSAGDNKYSRLDCAGKVGLWIIYGDEAGSAAPIRVETAPLPAVDPSVPTQIRALGDLNGDGLADFGFIEPTTGIVRIFYGNSGGKPVERRLQLSPESVPGEMLWALYGAIDRDGDGYGDLIIGRVQTATDTDSGGPHTLIGIRP